MAFERFYLTDGGTELLAKAQVGGSLTFTRAAAGDGTLNDQSITSLTELISKVMYLQISEAKCTVAKTVDVTIQFTNKDIQAPFYWREIGLYAKGSDGKEILYAYANSCGKADYIPSYGTSPTEFIFMMSSSIANAQNVIAEISKSLVFVPMERKINGHDLSNDVNLTAADVGARPSSWMPNASDVGAATKDDVNAVQDSVDDFKKQALTGAKVGDTDVTKEGGILHLPAYPVIPDSLPANGGTAAAVPWTGVTGKPATYPPSTHTHKYEEITDPPATLPANGGTADHVSWNGVTNKPASYPSTAHTHTSANITDWGSSSNSVASARQLKDAVTISNFDTFQPSLYAQGAVTPIKADASAGSPWNNTTSGLLLQSNGNDSWHLLIFRSGGDGWAYRSRYQGTWGAWQIWASKSQLANVATSGKYSDLSGTPTSLPANGGTAAAVPWSGVTGKPATYPPSTHTHKYAEITDPPAALPASGGTADNSNKLGGISSAGFAQSNSKEGIDLNSIQQSGMYRLGNANANMPNECCFGQLIVAHGAGDALLQIASDYYSVHIYWRSGNPLVSGGKWGAWNEFANQAWTQNLLSSYVPNTRKVNGHVLSGDVTLTAADVGAKPDTYNPDLSLYQLKSKNPTAGKKTGTTLGKDATAEGGETTASGDYSHAEGYETIASGDGFMYGCHAEGYQSTASGYVSHAEGVKTTASGAFAHAEGSNTIASGSCAHAEGMGTTANNNYSHAMGMDNKTMDESKVTGDALTIGNGSKDSPSNCFRVNFSGNVYGLSSYHSYGADYSEFFEWQDENPNAEDRVGKLVTLDGEKIRYAKQGDDILGIVSALPAIIGDSPADSWKERYVTDVFGRRVTEEVTVPAQPVKTDENGVEIMPVVPEHTETRFKVNPNYDPAKENEYENREKRPEWSTVGMLGKLVLIDDGTCAVNGYCQPSTIGDGTATKSDIQTNCRVMARLDSTHIKVLLK